MAANLTPQYYKAEEAYRKAQTTPEQIVALQEMLRIIPKHKGTDHLQGALKSKLKEAREAYQAELKTPKGGKSYRIPRQGCGTVVVIGAPNSGKSRLVSELTNASPDVAEFPYTTREPTAGMLEFEGALIQLIDTPPISGNQIEPYLIDFVRTADLVLFCFDGSSDDAPQETADVLRQLETRKTVLSEKTGFDPADFSIVHVKSRLILTRSNNPEAGIRQELLQEVRPIEFPVIPTDLDFEEQRKELAKSIFEALDKIRVYTKRPGEPVELVDPYVIPNGGTVEELAHRVHEEIAISLKFAKVWGQADHDGQAVGREHVLSDLDIVELHS
ncbi:GTPase [Thalassoglobus polymorphus]|uniref:GTPase Der n=1 Tax=Thalassoglobus polymorphus TaxID=2527994 RepID=A0A517QUF8_9PLAN|nr:GTPase [Thalassoglobus polymorphus]QDT35241.1 GTPase Der [Thalassoglobus polymorphus]